MEDHVENPFDQLAAGNGDSLLLIMTPAMRDWLKSPGVFRKLQGTHPDLQARVIKTITVMAIFGHRMMVTDGVREREQQMALYAQGRTRPGKIVTNCDGVIKLSNHQRKREPSRWAGFGAAADCTFVDDAGRPTWTDTEHYKLPWRLYGTVAKASQLVWGGDWPTMTDRPHVELFE